MVQTLGLLMDDNSVTWQYIYRIVFGPLESVWSPYVSVLFS